MLNNEIKSRMKACGITARKMAEKLNEGYSRDNNGYISLAKLYNYLDNRTNMPQDVQKEIEGILIDEEKIVKRDKEIYEKNFDVNTIEGMMDYEFIKHIRTRLQAIGYTMKQYSEMCFISYSRMSKYVNGFTPLSYKIRKQLMQGISNAELYHTAEQERTAQQYKEEKEAIEEQEKEDRIHVLHQRIRRESDPDGKWLQEICELEDYGNEYNVFKLIEIIGDPDGVIERKHRKYCEEIERKNQKYYEENHKPEENIDSEESKDNNDENKDDEITVF